MGEQKQSGAYKDKKSQVVKKLPGDEILYFLSLTFVNERQRKEEEEEGVGGKGGG